MLKTIFAKESLADAQARRDTHADALREKHRMHGTFMGASRDDVLACMDFARALAPDRRDEPARTGQP